VEVAARRSSEVNVVSHMRVAVIEQAVIEQAVVASQLAGMVNGTDAGDGHGHR